MPKSVLLAAGVRVQSGTLRKQKQRVKEPVNKMPLPYVTAKATGGKKKPAKKTPKGYHRMPDGSLMKGAKHATKRGKKK